MKQVWFDGMDQSLSEVGLGASKLGSAVPKKEAFAILDAFVDAGGTLIDTAHVYGGGQPGQKSVCEETVGAWMASRRAWHRVMVVGKGGHPAFNFATRKMGPSRVTPAALRQDLEMTLASLDVDTVDIYMPHRDDLSVPVAEIMEFLQDQVRKGKIRWYGCSNWSVPRMREAAAYAEAYGLTGFVCSQIEAPLGKINDEHLAPMGMAAADAPMLAWHEKTGMGLMTAVTLCGGYFHKTLAGEEPGPLQKAMFDNPVNAALAKTLAGFVKEGYPLTALLHAANLHRPFAAMSLMGFSSAAQWEEAREALAVPVPAEVCEKLWDARRKAEKRAAKA